MGEICVHLIRIGVLNPDLNTTQTANAQVFDVESDSKRYLNKVSLFLANLKEYDGTACGEQDKRAIMSKLVQVCKAMIREGYTRIGEPDDVKAVQADVGLIIGEFPKEDRENILQQVVDIIKESTYIRQRKAKSVNIGIPMERFGALDRVRKLAPLNSYVQEIEEYYKSGRTLPTNNPGHMKNFLLYLSILRGEEDNKLIPVMPITARKQTTKE